MVKLLAVSASHRKDSNNRKLLQLAANAAKAKGATLDVAEYSDFDMPLYDDSEYNPNALPSALLALHQRMQDVDGMMIASPEYNWSFPGSLKNTIDWLSRMNPQPFKGRTAFLLSASPSLKGGLPGLIQLRVPLEALEMHVYPQMYALSLSHEKMAVDGTLKESSQQELLDRMVTGYIHSTAALKSLR
jgi:NAD(P)H-dependent FMN reductase